MLVAKGERSQLVIFLIKKLGMLRYVLVARKQQHCPACNSLTLIEEHLKAILPYEIDYYSFDISQKDNPRLTAFQKEVMYVPSIHLVSSHIWHSFLEGTGGDLMDDHNVETMPQEGIQNIPIGHSLAEILAMWAMKAYSYATKNPFYWIEKCLKKTGAEGDRGAVISQTDDSVYDRITGTYLSKPEVYSYHHCDQEDYVIIN